MSRALQVLGFDASNVEAIACLAAHNFYTDQPEVRACRVVLWEGCSFTVPCCVLQLALRFYRRLLQMGVTNAELWNNLGLCCFYSSQASERCSGTRARAAARVVASLTRTLFCAV